MSEPLKQSPTSPGTVAAGVKVESELQRLLNQPHKGTCEYVPYGASDKVKLTVPIVQNLIAVKTKLGKTCSERDALKFIAMCQAKRINPFEGDCFLIGYDTRDGASFAMVTAHQTYLKRAELHPEFDGMKSGIIVEEDGQLKDLEGDFFMDGQQVVGGWAVVLFKNRKQPMHKRLRVARFQKQFGVWQEDPAGMICKCAEADALRSSFPTMLGGLYMREELEVEPAVPSFSKPMFTEKSAPAVTEAPAPEPEQTSPPEERDPDDGDLGPQPVEEPKPEPEKPAPASPLKELRMLLKIAKVKEGELLDFWSATGATDGSASSLEEAALGSAELVKATTGNWPAVAEQIKAQKSRGAA
jgi:phage recombination protein Bet